MWATLGLHAVARPTDQSRLETSQISLPASPGDRRPSSCPPRTPTTATRQAGRPARRSPVGRCWGRPPMRAEDPGRHDHAAATVEDTALVGRQQELTGPLYGSGRTQARRAGAGAGVSAS